MTTPAERWPDPFAPATSTDDYDPWAVEPTPAPAKSTPAPHEHDYAEATSPRALALGYRSRPVCRICGDAKRDEPWRCADCEHERTHLEVRHGTTDRRRYVEICDDCTVQLREVDA